MIPPVHRRKGSILQTAKAVLWSFVGLRTRGDYEKDVERLNPVHIVIIGLLACAGFVGSLILLASWAVSK